MLDKHFSPENLEKKWYSEWEKNKYFSPSGNTNPYCIVIPPPNVTGSLHMGHAFQDTLMDILIRRQRMLGNSTLWQMGTDHAGIATQMVVERQLQKKGIARQTLGREAFIQKVFDWKEHSGNTIAKQLRRLGASVDWSSERFTMDKAFSEAVSNVFVQLYNEGLIYKGVRLVNWDTVLQSAVSDLEVQNHEEKGTLWTIQYPIAESHELISIATTRPETMLGDVAVAVHPEDPRYAAFIGKKIALPLTTRTIPIIADEYVDPKFGTGAVKITPAHDFNDFEVGQRHKLSPINILTPTGHLNEHVPEKFRNLDRFEARIAVLNSLKELGLLEKTEVHTLSVPRGDRSGSILEPFLTPQWFLKTNALAAPAIEAVKKKQVRFIPENWENTYFDWMKNLQDWCISRQLWWGHQIPAWYDQEGKVFVGKNEAEIRKNHQLPANYTLKQDEDVLDTWFSSALWPFVTQGWPDKTSNQYTQFYPTQVLITGFDIIFFWVARMMMMGFKFTNKAPFQEIYIHGLIQDPFGQKMSKSKGNVIDPIDLIDGISLHELIKKRTENLMQPDMAKKVEEATKKQFPQGINAHGTDALRFTFCALASFNRHIRFDPLRLEGYKHFCNKLWNAARFVFMQIEQECPKKIQQPIDFKKLSPINQWILSTWQKNKTQCDKHLKHYRFDLLAQTLYDFVWNNYCDWYLEFSKTNAKLETYQVLVLVLDEILRTLHPIMPFITEEIWQKLKPYTSHQSQSIMLAQYPLAEQAYVNTTAEKDMEWLKQTISAIRTIRAEMTLSPKTALSLKVQSDSQITLERLETYRAYMVELANINAYQLVEKPTHHVKNAAIFMVENTAFYIPLEGLVDLEKEKERLTKTLTKLKTEIARIEKKFTNQKFVSNAPKEILKKEKQSLQNIQLKIQNLEVQLKLFD